MMLLTNKPRQQVKIPSNPSRRDLVSRARGAAALRNAGFAVEIVVGPIADGEGAPAWALALRKQCEDAIHEFRRRTPEVHARKTLEALRAPPMTPQEEVVALLEAAYRAHASGQRGKDLL